MRLFALARPARMVLAALLVFPAAVPLAQAADDARASEIFQAQCAICHGPDGESSTDVFPRLAAQHAGYVARQLEDFQTGRRKSAVMSSLVRQLSPAEMQAIGRWLESRPVRAHEVLDPALAARGRGVYRDGIPAKGVPACWKCHGEAGEGTDTLPRVGGQHAQYLENQLRAFGKRERTNDSMVMQTIAVRIGEDELRAVSSYISGLK